MMAAREPHLILRDAAIKENHQSTRGTTTLLLLLLLCTPTLYSHKTTMKLATTVVLASLSATATNASFFKSPATFGRLVPPGWSVAAAIRGGSMGKIRLMTIQLLVQYCPELPFEMIVHLLSFSLFSFF